MRTSNSSVHRHKGNEIRAASWQNQKYGTCAQRRLRSTWAFAQSDQSLRCPHEESLGPYLQRRLWSDWAESSLGVHAILLVLSRCGLIKQNQYWQQTKMRTGQQIQHWSKWNRVGPTTDRASGDHQKPSSRSIHNLRSFVNTPKKFVNSWVGSWEIMENVTSLTTPDPGLSLILFQNKVS